MEAHPKETPKNCHFCDVCSDRLSTFKQREKSNSNKYSNHSIDIMEFMKIKNDKLIFFHYAQQSYNNPLQILIPDNFDHTFQKTGLLFGLS